MQMDAEDKALLAEANAAETRQQAGVRVEVEDEEEPMKIVKDYQRPSARFAPSPAAHTSPVSLANPHLCNTLSGSPTQLYMN